MTVRVETRVNWTGDRVAGAVFDRAMDGLRDVGELVLEESGARVPHQTGELERSGEVTENRAAGEVVISYDTPYARRQHEERGYRHPKGEAKYLENAFDEIGEEAMELVAEQIRRELGM
jgi:hypothetical protein